MAHDRKEFPCAVCGCTAFESASQRFTCDGHTEHVCDSFESCMACGTLRCVEIPLRRLRRGEPEIRTMEDLPYKVYDKRGNITSHSGISRSTEYWEGIYLESGYTIIWNGEKIVDSKNKKGFKNDQMQH